MSVAPDSMGSLADLPDATQPTSVTPVGMPTVKQPGGYQPPAPPPAPFGANPSLMSATSGAGAAAPKPAAPKAKPAPPMPIEEDPFKDPQVVALEKQAEEDRAKEHARTEQAVAGLDAMQNAPPPPEAPQMQAQAPQYQQFAKQVSPLLMIMTAVGGKVAGLSGMNMLGALTGMVEGTAEGNKERYDAAFKEWKENRDAMMDDFKNKMEVYKQVMAWNKGKVDAQMQAVQMYQTMAGEESKDSMNLVSKHEAYVKAISQIGEKDRQLTLANERIELQRQELGLKQSKEDTKKAKDTQKVQEVSDRYVDAGSEVVTAWHNLRNAMKSDPELASAVSAGALLDSTKLQKVNQMSSRAVAAFTSAASNFKGIGFSKQIEGVPASALRIKGVDTQEMAALPDPSQTPDVLDFTIDRIDRQVKKIKGSGSAPASPQGKGTADDPIKLD